MSRPLLLDLFCGAGGAATGYHRAGFDVVGVDIVPQPRYPFTFVQADALEFDPAGFDVVHASPPCQRYSVASRAHNGHAAEHPDLVGTVREHLRSWGGVYTIENVLGAPLRDPVRLCGVMFPGLRVIRHRLFESTVALSAPAHGPHPPVHTMDRRKPHYGRLDQDTAFVQVTGGGNCRLVNARAAMGIDWMLKAELNEAIPPAYTEHLGRQMLEALR